MDLLVVVLLLGLASAAGGLVTGLVLRKEIPQIRPGGIAILALGWGIAAALAIVAYSLLWNVPVWVSALAFGTVFGVIGGGVTLWQIRRGREAATTGE